MLTLSRLALPLAMTALLLAPPGTAPGAPPAGTPSADPADPVRLLGGEAFVYQFDDGDFDTVRPGSVLDQSPFGSVAQRSGGAGVTNGPNGLGQALSLGGGQALYGTPLGVNTLTDDFSLALWTANGYPYDVRALYGAASGDNAPYYTQMILLFHSYSSLVLHIRDSVGVVRGYDLGYTLTSSWQHLAVVKEGLTLRLYVNGALHSSQVAAPGLYRGSAIVNDHIGVFPWYQWYIGSLDELRLYDRALSAGEVVSLRDFPYASPNVPPVADAGVDAVAACTGPTTVVGLDASGSSDANGDALTFAWSAGVPVADPSAPVTQAPFPLGTTVARVAVSDGRASDDDAVAVRVVDFSPPVITATFPDEPGLYAGDAFLGLQGTPDRVVLGSLDVAAEATDLCSSVAAIEFTVDDGTRVFDTTAPFGFSYAPEGLGVQYQRLGIVAIDSFGNRSPATTFDLTVVALDPRLPAGAPEGPALPPLPVPA